MPRIRREARDDPHHQPSPATAALAAVAGVDPAHIVTGWLLVIGSVDPARLPGGGGMVRVDMSLEIGCMALTLEAAELILDAAAELAPKDFSAGH